MKKHRNLLQHIFSFLLAILLTFSSVGLSSASLKGDQSMLIRIDLHSADEIENTANLAIPVHARITNTAGNLSILGFVDHQQLAALEGQQLSVQILDHNPQGKDYFWVQLPTSEAREKLAYAGTVLDYFEDQALVTVNPEAVESLFRSGLNFKHFSSEPLPLLEPEVAPQIPSTIVPDPRVQSMLDQVTATMVSDYDGGLSGVTPVTIGGSSYTMATRHSSNATASTMATQYAYEQFSDLGLSVAYHNYNHPYYGARRNVVAEQTGSSQPERVILITAHIDDMPSGSTAPGADDNASGSTGVLIAAEILSQYDFDCTLRYVLFTGEEQGLYGSHYYALDAYNSGDNIEAVLNLDMIAYNSDSLPRLDLHTRLKNGADLAIANLFSDVVTAYQLNLEPQIFQDGMGYSDHDSFWDYGFPAILAIEDDDDFTPYYHTINDTLATLNLTYFRDFVKASLGTLAHMGCLSELSNYELYLPAVLNAEP